VLFVPTKIGISQTHGIGIFARKLIKKGTLVWRFKPGFDLSISEADMKTYSPEAVLQVKNYGYLDNSTGLYILCSDDARFFNHSDNHNVGPLPNQKDLTALSDDFALRDIQEGEEIFCNYDIFDGDTDYKLGRT
jgi:SET domain-containing protein